MADLNFKLLKWQKEVLNDKHRFKVIVAGRRCGKSNYSIFSLLINGLNCPKGANVMYIAPTQGQARVIIWNKLLDIGRDVIESTHVNNMEVKLINGVIIYVRGADNHETLRGTALWHVVLDEYADIKPIVWEQTIRAALSDYRGTALFIGTPKGRNHFFDIYNIGEEDNDSEWKSWHFTTMDNELIPKDEIEAARRSMSSFSFKQEYLASFDNAGADLFKEDWLKYGDEPVDGTYLVSVDLAGFEAVSNAKGLKKKLDQTAISIVKVTDDGKWFVKKIIYGRWDVRENAIRILKAIRDYRPSQVGIEKGALYNAVMPYLSDLMRKNGVFAHIQPLTHGNQKKNDRVMWALQGRFEHGRIILNKDEEWSEFVDQYLMFPTSGVHDDCFPAETPIITKNGVKQISEITTDDYVLTRNGYRKVLKAWCKGNKEVITRFGITATPDHRIFTENKGWVSLDSLSANDIPVVAQTIGSCELRADIGQLQCAAKNAEEHEAIDCKTQNIVPVYDLMVEHDHEFFAYGVLVHNCIDSLSLVDQMAISNYGSGDDDSDGFEPIEIITGY